MSYDASHEFYEQKILLAPLRLQEAGFIMRPETPEVPGQSWLKATGRMQGGAAGLEAGAGAGG